MQVTGNIGRQCDRRPSTVAAPRWSGGVSLLGVMKYDGLSTGRSRLHPSQDHEIPPFAHNLDPSPIRSFVGNCEQAFLASFLDAFAILAPRHRRCLDATAALGSRA